MAIIPTPKVATKNEDFSNSQKRDYKNALQLNGTDKFTLTQNGANNWDCPLELKTNMVYSFISNTSIIDGDNITDTQAVNFTVFMLNTQSVLANNLIELEVIGNTAFIYTF